MWARWVLGGPQRAQSEPILLGPPDLTSSLHLPWGCQAPSPGGASGGGAGDHQAGLQQKELIRSPSGSPRAAGAPPGGGQRSRRLKPPFPTLALLGTLVSSLPPLWGWPKVAQTKSFLCLIQAFCGSLRLAKVPRAPAAAHLRVLPAASPLSAPPARFWIFSSFSPTSQRHCPTSASPLPWNP